MTDQVRKSVPPNRLILSLFPGIDLFSIPFEERGFSVVRGPDKIFGQDIRNFHVPPGCFSGIIGGSPCQEFSLLNRNEPTGYGQEMLDEFMRVVSESNPDWWLLENVACVPDVKIDGYNWQRFSLDLAWFTENSRLRHFQFGSKHGLVLDPPLGVRSSSIKNTAALASDDRSFSQIKGIQGLSSDFDLPFFTVEGKKRAVGNGVPIPLGRVLAMLIDRDIYGVTVQASNNVTEPGLYSVTGRCQDSVTCLCGCGRSVYGKARYASSACRKRVSRSRNKSLSSIQRPKSVHFDEA